jgi:glycosyltransferase involved in cell wall biosynthesis
MKRKLIFLVTEDWYFHMHRLPQARAARDAGYDVAVAARVRDHGGAIEAEGFRLLPLRWKRGSLNPLAAALAIFEIARLYRRERPEIVHHVSLKAILFGTIAAKLAGLPVIVNAFTGLGQLFLGDTARIKVLRVMVFPVLRQALRGKAVHAIVENADHLQALIDLRMLRPDQAIVIRGSGIDTGRFAVMPEPAGQLVAGCAARMLRGKGIPVLAEAMRLLQGRCALTLRLAGMPDPDSTDSLSASEMQAIAALPNIEWLGRISDMPDFWAGTHIGVLASISGEGLPVSLLEAAACGRALVASDVAGCREIVVPGLNGTLVPPHDAAALADALQSLASDEELRRCYGAASRALVEREFSAAMVGRRTVELYQNLLERADD